MKLTTIFITASVLVAVGCGDGALHQGSSSTSSAPTPAENGKTSDSATPLPFTGYVLNAFDVKVDGQSYTDLEDYFTKEVTRLPSRLKEAGYSSNDRATFEAQIGFRDLWTNMDVYVSPTGKQGYQGTGQVGNDGKFSVTLPAAAVDSTYRVRSNKRIRVVITKDGAQHNVCYNFSAMEQSVPLTRDGKPIILDTFASQLTAYDCPQSTSGGLSLPKADTTGTTGSAPLPKSALIRKGMTKADALATLGRSQLTMASDSRWCFMPTAGTDTVCQVDFAGPCRCSLEFNADGTVAAQYNIRSDYLDLSAW